MGHDQLKFRRKGVTAEDGVSAILDLLDAAEQGKMFVNFFIKAIVEYHGKNNYLRATVKKFVRELSKMFIK